MFTQYYVIFLIWLLFPILFILAPLFLILKRRKSNSTTSQGTILSDLKPKSFKQTLVTLICAVMTIFALFQLPNYICDIPTVLTGNYETQTGYITNVKKDRQKFIGTHYELSVNDETLISADEIRTAKKVTFYYLPNTKVVKSYIIN